MKILWLGEKVIKRHVMDADWGHFIAEGRRYIIRAYNPYDSIVEARRAGHLPPVRFPSVIFCR